MIAGAHMTLWYLISDVFLAIILSTGLAVLGAWWMHSKMHVHVLLNVLMSILLFVISIAQFSLFFWAGTIENQLYSMYELSNDSGIQELMNSAEGYSRFIPMVHELADAGIAKFQEILDFIYWYRIRRMLWLAGTTLFVVVIAILKGRGSKSASLDFGPSDSDSTSSASLNF